MFNYFDGLIIGAKNKISGWVSEFRNDEHGVSSFVATILLILIVVLLCGLFWSYISQWFEDVWKQIMGEAGTIK